MHLSTFLKKRGYIQIPLYKSGVGHFHTEGLLNGHLISVLIDTGASNTIFSLELIKKINLGLVKLPMQGGGAGSSKMDVYQVQDPEFIVAGFSPKVKALFAMDFSHVNQALEGKSEEPVEAVLGVDILEAHSAIIDYASNSLFLK
jgi:hypothetical protein